MVSLWEMLWVVVVLKNALISLILIKFSYPIVLICVCLCVKSCFILHNIYNSWRYERKRVNKFCSSAQLKCVGYASFLGQSCAEVHWGHLWEDPPQYSGPDRCSRSWQIGCSRIGCGRSCGFWVTLIFIILCWMGKMNHTALPLSVVLQKVFSIPQRLCDFVTPAEWMRP